MCVIIVHLLIAFVDIWTCDPWSIWPEKNTTGQVTQQRYYFRLIKYTILVRLLVPMVRLLPRVIPALFLLATRSCKTNVDIDNVCLLCSVTSGCSISVSRKTLQPQRRIDLRQQQQQPLVVGILNINVREASTVSLAVDCSSCCYCHRVSRSNRRSFTTSFSCLWTSYCLPAICVFRTPHNIRRSLVCL